MAFVTITEASRLVNKATVTLYRHIKKGQLSRGSDGKIDTAELIRCYGGLNGDDTTPDATGNTTSNEPVLQRDTANDTTVITALLQEQITELKQRMDEANRREERLLKMLESKLLQDNSSDSTLKKFKFW